jgi:hypothetical protein
VDKGMLVFAETNVERWGSRNRRRLLISNFSPDTAKKECVRKRPFNETNETPLES